jgi:sigma-B regulation protein RsbU (phosphoserine phosphatase)
MRLYFTAFYGAFDENTRTQQYVNAGHNPTVVIRGDRAVTWLEASAPPVGFFAETFYQAQAVQLYLGDLILAYTDRVVETTNTASEEWRVEGLLAAVECCQTRQPESIVGVAFTALDEFSDDNQTDDATILAALVH